MANVLSYYKINNKNRVAIDLEDDDGEGIGLVFNSRYSLRDFAKKLLEYSQAVPED